ncbi:hypothetical protein Undi14_00315 [Undibacterium sp. 14-3-2]|uniref:hypothetical protein n=1 Tax=Undibacterium sp. 14-3-2 TaxID=2800129 RepID=UPI00190783E8|nr:hypothetical protein [Undibacterium sp. 14-3-2]MBK1888456.1 hypothetical protein [Undibacterium sp. 14-3-2]
MWLFWSDRGQLLEPQFTVPNKRGFFVVRNGTYNLVPAEADHHAILTEALEEVLTFESPAPFNSAQGVRSYLESRNTA